MIAQEPIEIEKQLLPTGTICIVENKDPYVELTAFLIKDLLLKSEIPHSVFLLSKEDIEYLSQIQALASA